MSVLELSSNNPIFHALEEAMSGLPARMNSMVSHYLPPPGKAEIEEFLDTVFQDIYCGIGGVGGDGKAFVERYAAHITTITLPNDMAHFSMLKTRRDNFLAMRRVALAICELLPEATVVVPSSWSQSKAAFVPNPEDSDEDILEYSTEELPWKPVIESSPILKERLRIKGAE